MKKLLVWLAAILLVAGGLTMFGSNYATKTVHDQLSAQKIYFPKDTASGLFPDLKQYAGQQVTTGPMAKAYADQFIARHLVTIGGGKTYSEVSEQFLSDPTNAQLAQTRQSLFMGETLRGLLLNAWGWSLIGTIAWYAGTGLIAVAVAILAATLFVPTHRPKSRRKK